MVQQPGQVLHSVVCCADRVALLQPGLGRGQQPAGAEVPRQLRGRRLPGELSCRQLHRVTAPLADAGHGAAECAGGERRAAGGGRGGGRGGQQQEQDSNARILRPGKH